MHEQQTRRWCDIAVTPEMCFSNWTESNGKTVKGNSYTGRYREASLGALRHFDNAASGMEGRDFILTFHPTSRVQRYGFIGKSIPGFFS